MGKLFAAVGVSIVWGVIILAGLAALVAVVGVLAYAARYGWDMAGG